MNCISCNKVINKVNKQCRECYDRGRKINISIMKKKEIFSDSRSWQAARSAIQDNARLIYFENNKNPSCLKCKYNLHVQVCHVKAVSAFDGDTLIGEINDIKNLIGLCPTHHWEFDNDILKIDGLNVIKAPKRKRLPRIKSTFDVYAPREKTRKVKRPTKEELHELIWKLPTTHVAKKFGVSDKAVSKWVKWYCLNKPPRGYWAKQSGYLV